MYLFCFVAFIHISLSGCICICICLGKGSWVIAYGLKSDCIWLTLDCLWLTGKSLLDVFFLTRVLMMTMRDAYWPNWSNNAVVSSPQRWRGWSVPLANPSRTVVLMLGTCNQKWMLLCIFQVTDLTLAKENQTNFEEYLNSNSQANPGIDLTVTVLTTGFWPSYKSFDLNLPAELVCMDSAEIFFSAV